MIEHRSFVCFVAVAHERSFTRAAERLDMAQPNLSRMIAGLEQRLGGALFVRGKRPLTLSALGHKLLPSAQAMARAASELEQKMLQVRREIGTGAMIGGHASFEKIPERQRLIDRFMKDNPSFSLRIIELSPDRRTDALRDGEVDFLFAISPLSPPTISLRLATYPVKLAVPAELSIARLDDIPPEALDGLTVIDWTGVEGAMHATVIAPIAEAGAIMTPTPELSVSANLHYAADRRAIFPILSVFESTEKISPDFVVKTFAGNTIQVHLWLSALKQPSGPAHRALWRAAQAVACGEAS